MSWRTNRTRNFSSSFAISPITKRTEVRQSYSAVSLSDCLVIVWYFWIRSWYYVKKIYFTICSWLISSIFSKLLAFIRSYYNRLVFFIFKSLLLDIAFGSFVLALSCSERRVSDLKKRMLDLTSDLESVNSDLQVAKQSREMAEQDLKGTQVQLAMTCASIQALEV